MDSPVDMKCEISDNICAVGSGKVGEGHAYESTPDNANVNLRTTLDEVVGGCP